MCQLRKLKYTSGKQKHTLELDLRLFYLNETFNIIIMINCESSLKRSIVSNLYTICPGHSHIRCANTMFTDSLLAHVSIVVPHIFHTMPSYGQSHSPNLFLWHRLSLMVVCPPPTFYSLDVTCDVILIDALCNINGAHSGLSNRTKMDARTFYRNKMNRPTHSCAKSSNRPFGSINHCTVATQVQWYLS